MEMPSAVVAAANALALCEENNEIDCTICLTGSRLRDWKKHIFDPAHLRALEQFNLIFERKYGKVHCIPCNANFHWHELRIHAKTHMILPWHKSDDDYDKYEIFFENRIIEWKNIFQCCLCDATFSEWNIVFVHTTDPIHRDLYEKTSPWIYEFPDDAVSYEFLVTEGIIAHSEISLECRICRVIVAVDSVGKHAKGLMHRSNKSKFRLEFNERKENETINEMIRRNVPSDELSEAIEVESSTNQRAIEVESSTKQRAIEVESSTNQQAIDRESLSRLYIEKRDETDSYCVICHCIMFHHSIKNHLKDKDHVDAERIYGCDEISPMNGNEYRCEICERQLTGAACVRSHVTGGKHLKSLNASMQKRLQRKSINDEISKRPEIVENEFPNVNDDILLENGVYNCKCCNFEITGLENLYAHLKGRKHSYRSMKTPIQTFSDEADGIERSANVIELCNDRSTDHYLAKPNDNDYHCPHRESSKECYVNISHVSNDLYRCDATISTVAKVRPNNAENSNLVSWKSFREQRFPVRQSVEPLRSPNVDSRTREENHSSTLEESKSRQIRWKLRNFEIPRRPNVNLNTKKEDRLDSSNKSKRQEIQQSSEDIFVFERSFRNYLVKENETDFRCKVCDCVIYGSWENMNIHLTGSHHAESLKKYGCDYVSHKGGNIYHCECCDLAIANLENVYFHVKNINHANLVAKLRTNGSNSKKVAKQEDRANENSYDEQSRGDETTTEKLDIPKPREVALPVIYILRKNDAVSHCNVCDIALSSSEQILEHILSTDHAAAMMKYGCDRILHEGGDDFCCVCCECKISGCPNVCEHVRGRRHYFGLRNLVNTEDLKRAKRNINELKFSEEQEFKATVSTITGEISKLLDQKRIRESKSRRKQTNLK